MAKQKKQRGEIIKIPSEALASLGRILGYLQGHRRSAIARRYDGASDYLRREQWRQDGGKGRVPPEIERPELDVAPPEEDILDSPVPREGGLPELDLKRPCWSKAVAAIKAQQKAWWELYERHLADGWLLGDGRELFEDAHPQEQRAYREATERRYKVCDELPPQQHLALAVVLNADAAAGRKTAEAMWWADWLLPAWTDDPAEAEQELIRIQQSERGKKSAEQRKAESEERNALLSTEYAESLKAAMDKMEPRRTASARIIKDMAHRYEYTVKVMRAILKPRAKRPS